MIWRIVILGAALIGPLPLHAKVYLTHQQALTLAFPPPIATERKTVFLTPDQVSEVEKKSGVKATSKIVAYYRGVDQAGRLTGYAFFDSHIVRTKAETFMVVVNPDETLRFVEILVFDEPEEFRPTPGWLKELKGKKLDPALRVRRGISNMAGATLTSLALTDGVRRIMATVPEVIKAKAK